MSAAASASSSSSSSTSATNEEVPHLPEASADESWIDEILAQHDFTADERVIGKQLLLNAPPMQMLIPEVKDLGFAPVKSSVAGASSADFHRYKRMRRELAEQSDEMTKEFDRQVKNLAFLQRRAAAAHVEAEKTAKRAAKRRAQKQKQKAKKQRV